MTETTLTQIITLVGALLSGGLGGFIAIQVSRDQLNQKTKAIDDERRIRNMERLHEALSELATTARHLQVAIFAKLIKGMPIPKDDFFNISFERMNMLVDFYVPSMRADADRITKGFNELFAAGADAGEKPLVVGEDVLRRRAFYGANEVDEAVKNAKSKLATLMKHYAIAS